MYFYHINETLTGQGVDVGNFEEYIKENSPVWFTNPNADPYITPNGNKLKTSDLLGIRSYIPPE